MSLFGSLMGDFDDDIYGNHMNAMNAMNMQMRSMNRLMNTFMPDPFNMLAPFDHGFQQNALMERQNGPPPMGGLFGFPPMPHMQAMQMPNMNRLLSADIGNNGACFSSSSVITMSSGPDGRPQIYQATSSTKTGPGGVRETRRTVQDSMNGVKKMAIGHHIGERAHIIEKEQDLRSGQLEERQEFINLEEDDAEDFDREFTNRASSGRGGPRAIAAAPPTQTLTIEPLDDDDDDVIETTALPQQPLPPQRPSSGTQSHQRRYMPATPAPPTQQPQQNSSTSAIETQSSSSLPTPSLPSAGPATSNTSSSLSSSASVNVANPYTPRRSSAYRSSHLNGGVSSRRPLRTAPSSPLATTPTMHNHSTASSPSVHPHPYNSSAARRPHHHHHNHHQHHHHRGKHAKQHSNNSSSKSPKPAEEHNRQN